MALDPSILNSTKKILGIPDDYPVYDLDILTHINTTFAILNQLGVGPLEGFFIEDEDAEWSDYEVPDNQLQTVKTYIFLKVKSLFDPPTIGYLVDATDRQLRELEWRLNVFREGDKYPIPEGDTSVYEYTEK